MKAILIPVDGEIEQVTLEPAGGGLRSMQKLVGGDVESLPYPGRRNLCLMINDDGKPYGGEPGLPRNDAATRLMANMLMTGDWIAGDAVVVGIDQMGETVDVPYDLIVEIEALTKGRG